MMTPSYYHRHDCAPSINQNSDEIMLYDSKMSVADKNRHAFPWHVSVGQLGSDVPGCQFGSSLSQLPSFWVRQLSGAGFYHGTEESKPNQTKHAGVLKVSDHTTMAQILLAKATSMSRPTVNETVVTGRYCKSRGKRYRFIILFTEAKMKFWKNRISQLHHLHSIMSFFSIVITKQNPKSCLSPLHSFSNTCTLKLITKKLLNIPTLSQSLIFMSTDLKG